MQLSLRQRPRLRVSSPLNAGQKQKALTASGMAVSRGSGDSLRRLVQPWQSRAYAYYDVLGEIKYAAQFYSRAISNLRLFAAEKNDDGEWVPTENEDAKAQLARIQDPGGGLTGILSSYGRLMFLAGECYLFVTIDKETGDEEWEVLSTDELRIQGDSYYRVKAPALGIEELKGPSDDPESWQEGSLKQGEAMAYRLWKRHPRYSMLADSSMQGVLDLCEELVILTQAVRSRARSRLAGAGILVVDDRISPAPMITGQDEDANADPFVRDLVAAMMAPIGDEGVASAIVPLVVRCTVPDGARAADLLSLLPIVDPTQFYPESGLRSECIDRIAIGLDMPPEVLKGLQDSNHWTSWQIDEQTWKGHLQPIAQQLVDDLSGAFYRPTLRAAGVPDAERYAIRFDAAAIINHPDRTRDAKDLHDRAVIGDAALLDACGFNEADAATDDEVNRRLGILMRDSSLAVYGIPSLRANTELEPDDGVLQGPAPPDSTSDPATGNDVVKGPPPEPTNDPPTSLTGSNGYGSARILGAADFAIFRAREVAGNRLVSLAKRDAEMRDIVRDVAGRDVAATLGADRVKTLGESERSLVAGCRPLIVDTLRHLGLPREVSERLADMIEAHAARTLYEPNVSGMPPAFQNYVAGLTAAVPS